MEMVLLFQMNLLQWSKLVTSRQHISTGLLATQSFQNFLHVSNASTNKLNI